MKIGANPGHSIPAENRDPFKACGKTPGKYQTGDATLNLGEYIGVLATEYKLLKDANQDVTATANELYYAINAVRRLDRFAEQFFGKTAVENGFFIRDDWPGDMFRTINTNEVDLSGNYISDTKANYRPLNGGLYHFQQTNREEGPIPNPGSTISSTSIQTKDYVQLYKDGSDENLVYTVDGAKECLYGRDNTLPTEVKRLSEMSQDQIIGLIMGFYAVKKFVPSDAGAKPMAIDDYMNFHSMLADITHNILTFVSKKKTVRNMDVLVNEDTTYRIVKFEKMTTSWFINNPANGDKRALRGFAMWQYAKPLARIGEEITGQSYSTTIVFHLPKLEDRTKLWFNTSFLGFANTGCKVLMSAGAEKHEADGTEYKTFKKVGRCVGGGFLGAIAGSIATPVLYPVTFGHLVTGDLNLPSADKMWKIALWYAASSENNLASQMTIKLAAMDPAFNSSRLCQPLTLTDKLKIFVSSQIGPPFSSANDYYYNTFTNLFANHLEHKLYFNLLPNAYHPGNSNVLGRDGLRDYLNSAPCSGTGSHPTRQANSALDKMWLHGDMMSLSKQSTLRSKLKPEETIGISYMLFHNLYRIVYASQINDPFKVQTCPCVSTTMVEYIHYPDGKYAVQEFDNQSVLDKVRSQETIITPRKFSDYADIKIPKPFYISHNVNIKDDGILRVAGDLTVCGAEMEVETGGELFIPNTDPNYPTVMEIDNGGHLTFDRSSTLRIGDNSTLVIGSGGFMTIDRHVSIILDGPSSHLVIEGELELKDHASLLVTSGANGLGYITFRQDKNADNGNETFARIVAGNQSRINIRGAGSTQKVLEIDGNFGLVVPENLVSFTVENGGIEMGRKSRLQVKGAVTLSNCQINTINKSKDYYYYAGLITQGQPNVRIRNCVFKQGLYGVLAQNYFYPHVKPSISDCHFENMITAIRMDGGGVDIENTTAQNNTSNISAKGVNVACTFDHVYFSGGKLNLFSGGSSAVLDWDFGGAQRSNTDGLTLIGGTFKPHCLRISKNKNNGIYTRGNAFVSLSANASDGFNYLNNNDIAIYNREYTGDLFGLGDAQGLGIDLMNGYNSFESNHLYSLDIILNTGSSFLFQGNRYLETSNNYWGTSSAPLLGQEYEMLHKEGYALAAQPAEVETYGNHLTSSFQHLQKQAGVCFQGMVRPPIGGIILKAMEGDDRIETFRAGPYGNMLVTEVFDHGMQHLYHDQDYELAMDEFQALVLHDMTCDSLENGDQFMYKSYRNYLNAGSYLLGDSLVASVRKSEIIDETINTLSLLVLKSEDTSSIWNAHRLMIKMDLADRYRAKDERLSAIAIYDELLNDTAFAENLDLIDFYKCMTVAENRVINGEISIFEKLDMYDCPLPINDNPQAIGYISGDTDTSQEDSSLEPSFEILLHPNPTNGQVTLNFNQEIIDAFDGQTATVILSNGYGVPQETLQNVELTASTSIDLTSYQAGIYYIQCHVGIEIFSKYLILSDQ